MVRSFLLLAAFFGFTGVALGAFGAHGLKDKLTPEYLAIFQTAVHYQQIHALALLGIAVAVQRTPTALLAWSGSLFCAGILLFSGSLYLLTMTGVGKLGIVTPIGGLAFMAGWLCLGLAAWRLA
ncbi:DUF423 domain-containing protein [Azomonas macrocytogenes]|uniref:Uncharacterized membrane protein YgdD (TMEM256/DUF423 family) n=1 Tax=Azomonas macrocytogenes TaxID=69962 RepID=A0A839T545_AZOMA|nr:DUF423 domain-containing protein [Azomonas macrocytogenes]MBB3103434.1 uncharacterized membrane protein YgdD (TMEM256/DUF423 family) [Azomonas macrocytogenes]